MQNNVEVIIDLLIILRIREQFAVNRDIHDYLRLFINIHK